MISKTFNLSILVQCCFVILPLIASVTSQICTTHKMVRTTYELPQTYSYTISYNAKCWYGKCRKTKWKQGIRMRTVSRMDLQPVEECCDGYYKDSENSTLICKPICMPQCQNGYCKSPGDCVCDDGYKKDSTNLNNCLPHCPGCDNEMGTCLSPGKCECDKGYTLIDERCRPVCDPECRNGTCMKPDVCSCDEGYTLVNNTCVPICESSCGNGTCVEPDICECFEGYATSDDCNPDCCKPKCDDCGTGTCYEPGICQCEPGFENENGTCIPECKFDCGHGICISPDKCECDPGFHDTRYEIDNQTVCEPVCQNCEGICIAPDLCVCEHPLEAKNVTHEGEDCECFSDCQKVCVKTICVAQNPVHVTAAMPPDTDLPTLGIIATEEVEMTAGIRIDYNDIEYTTVMPATKRDDTPRYYYNNTFEYLSNKTQKEQDERGLPYWVYAIITVLLLVFLALLIFIMIKLQFIPKYFRRNGGSYEVEDHHHSSL